VISSKDAAVLFLRVPKTASAPGATESGPSVARPLLVAQDGSDS
jgi:hypothetical protein